MSDMGFLLLFALVALGVAWLANALVSIMSGEHPRDTGRTWLNIMYGELRGLFDGLSLIRLRWVRWSIVLVLGCAVFLILFFVYGSSPTPK